MRRAIELAASVDLRADSNPTVGAVVVSADGHIVGEGVHQGAGTAHAEVVALAQAGQKARGASVYCTLEPCNAQGRQGPCTEALIEAGVATVIYGQSDPTAAKSGGAMRLRDAGITVRQDQQDACETLNASWTFAHAHRRPWTIWKTATTLDGFVARTDGTSKWITGEPAREVVQELRAGVGAIVTGTGTVLADDPLLTVRDSQKTPLKVVMGRRQIPETAQIWPAEITTDEPLQVLEHLWATRGIHRVLVEAGPALSTSFWAAGLIDEVYWFRAPVIFGQGLRVLDDLRHPTIRRFPSMQVHRVGLDTVTHFRTH